MRGATRAAARRVALGAMVLVTAWSLWAWAQPNRLAPPAANNGAAPQSGQPVPPLNRHQARPSEEQHGEEANGREANEGDEAPAPMNWTQFGAETPPFVAMLVNFGILIAGYYLLGKRSIAAGLQSRRDHIAKDIDEAHRMKEEAEARAKTYQSRLENLEREAAAARDALVRAGEAERERIVAEAEAKAERMRRDAEFLLEQEMKQVRADLLRDTVEVAMTAASELLKQRVTQADQERLAEEYLSGLTRSAEVRS